MKFHRSQTAALLVFVGLASPVMALEATAPATEVSAEELAILGASLTAETSPVVPQVALGTWQVGPAVTMDLSLTLDVAGAYFHGDPSQMGGHDPAQTGFTLRQLELAAGANVDTYFRLDADIVFLLDGVEVEEAYASTLGLPAGLKVRLGQFFTRVGRWNPVHPHAWYFIDLPLVNGKFWGPDGNRGLGVELSWLAPMPWYLELIGSQTDAAGDCCARSWLGGEDYAIKSATDFISTIIAKQYWDLGANTGLSHGLSFQTGPNTSSGHYRTEIYASDLMLRYRPLASARRAGLTLQAEVMHRRRHDPAGVLADWGGYVFEIWHVASNWELGTRQEWATGLASDPLNPEWTATRDRYAAQLTWRPSHFSNFRLQGNYDRPHWRADPIWGAMLGAEFMIGAHGAHAY